MLEIPGALMVLSERLSHSGQFSGADQLLMLPISVNGPHLRHIYSYRGIGITCFAIHEFSAC